MNIAPFSGLPYCPKCGNGEPKYRHVTSYQLPTGKLIEEEHLFLTCVACDYNWRMRCADWKDPDDMLF